VKNSYFNGDSWLIAVEFNSETVFIEHNCELQKEGLIHFKIDK
jgi:hypothetical protein